MFQRITTIVAILLLLAFILAGGRYPEWVIVPAVLLSVAGGVAEFCRNVRVGYAEADRKDRQRRGQCLHCGYSLKGNVSGVCPECGTAAAR